MALWLESWSQMRSYSSAGFRSQLFFLSSASTRHLGPAERTGYKKHTKQSQHDTRSQHRSCKKPLHFLAYDAASGGSVCCSITMIHCDENQSLLITRCSLVNNHREKGWAVGLSEGRSSSSSAVVKIAYKRCERRRVCWPSSFSEIRRVSN